jgi:chromate transporter
MLAYGLAGGLAAAVAGPWLALVLVGCGALELFGGRIASSLPALLAAGGDPAGAWALAWTSLKVGALAFGGGFVIVPLMQSDAVSTYHWMTHGQFLNAVALGQLTPGPVTHTVAAVGYSAAGVPGGLLAALVAFAPSFAFVLAGAERFERLVRDRRALAFLAGAAPCAAGAIVGAAIPLTTALSETWEYAVLAAGAIALLALRRGVVTTLLLAGFAGVVAASLGAPIPR